MGEKCIHGVRGRVCGDCHAEDMEAEVDRQDRVIQGLRDEIERLQARVEVLEGALDRVDYALENIWAIDRDRLRQLIAEAATEQGEKE